MSVTSPIIRKNKAHEMIKSIHVLRAALTFVILITERGLDVIGVKTFIFQFILCCIFIPMHYSTLVNLNYSYFTFTLAYGVFHISGFSTIIGYSHDDPFNVILKSIYIVVFTLLAIEIYLVQSPLFYPRIRWWEYDFRYRPDLKGWVVVDSESYEIRLSDFRGRDCCITAFQNFDLEKKYVLSVEGLENLNFEFEILSKRQYSKGRGYQYGVKLDRPDKTHLLKLKLLWKKFALVKINKKFQEFEDQSQSVNGQQS